MGFFEDLIDRTKKTIDEIEYSEDREQSLLDKFWSNRKDLEEGIDSAFGQEKNKLSSLLELLNRKGKENDMEPW
ncbi:hypothetical protein Q4512_16225 [Oceanihabitans sp. 2_MG-2023]|jgi:hypothetical protein|uniref:hypothetical protein n=1 Tax=Oceanihabitans sp. 2_MG-2023 TaxID=3062661 RepID=UPI0026E45800|nr:hypothetical protein [Oceanihabitans sp. 2_MG-2023]MDO6598467.1 hypothetical protein [Oceanihabitans sp. 2_MG-2023]